ncbi:MAG: hypothetical protein GY849_08845, partial [Deltaproteobacteria bacterium]|nr:hypothetical protein [Deltaproteobacteria bacterium]
EELRLYDMELADMAAAEFVKDKGEQGIQFVDIQEIEQVKAKTLQDLERGNTDRYEEAIDDINMVDYDTEVVVKTQRFDRNLIAKGLMNLAQIDPRFVEQITPQLNDLWGTNLKIPTALPEEEQQAQGQQQQAQPNLQGQLTEALTMQGQGV